MGKKDIYYPYNKSDFNKFYFAEDGKIHKYKIIRQLTEEEKTDFYKGDDYEEEMYEIKLDNGELSYAFDLDILKTDELEYCKWWKALFIMIDNMEYNEELLEKFVKFCKIEQFVDKYYCGKE